MDYRATPDQTDRNFAHSASTEEIPVRGALEDLEVAANGGVQHANASCLERPSGNAVRLLHTRDVQIVPAVAPTKVVGVNVVDVFAFGGDHIAIDVLRNRVLVVEADQDNRIAAEICGHLEVQ